MFGECHNVVGVIRRETHAPIYKMPGKPQYTQSYFIHPAVCVYYTQQAELTFYVYILGKSRTNVCGREVGAGLLQAAWKRWRTAKWWMECSR